MSAGRPMPRSPAATSPAVKPSASSSAAGPAGVAHAITEKPHRGSPSAGTDCTWCVPPSRAARLAAKACRTPRPPSGTPYRPPPAGCRELINQPQAPVPSHFVPARVSARPPVAPQIGTKRRLGRRAGTMRAAGSGFPDRHERNPRSLGNSVRFAGIRPGVRPWRPALATRSGGGRSGSIRAVS